MTTPAVEGSVSDLEAPRAPGSLLDRAWAAVVLAALAVALSLVAHASVTENAFVWDDVPEVVNNRSIENLSNLRAVLPPVRPIVNLSYAIDYRLWRGRDEYGFHLTNLRLHVAVVLLLFGFVRLVVRDLRVGGQQPGRAAENVTAFTAAALLAVHPMMTETVGYVSSRSEMLCGIFALASLFSFRQAMHARTPVSWSWLVVTWLCWGLALGSKETAVMLPFAFLAYDALLGPGGNEAKRARLWRVHVPLLSLILVAGAGRVWWFLTVEYPGVAAAPAYSAWASAHAAVRYVELLFVPAGQTIVHVVSPITSLHDRRILVAVLGLGLSAAVVLLARRRAPLISFGIIFFFLMLMPSSALTLLSDRGQVISEHRTYVASFGFFMAIGAIFGRVWVGPTFARGWWRPASAVVLAAVLVVMVSLTMSRNRVWRDSLSLWSDAAEKAPDTWLAVYGLAELYRDKRQCRLALDPYQRAIDLQPAKPSTYLGLAGCLLDIGNPVVAAQTLRLGLSHVPEDTTLLLLLASIEERELRNLPMALRLCQSALKLAPESAEAKLCVDRNQAFLAERRQGAQRR